MRDFQISRRSHYPIGVWCLSLNTHHELRLPETKSELPKTSTASLQHSFDKVAKMSSPSLNKIAPNSSSRQNPSEIETSIANALYDLETNIPDMRSSLRPLQFVSAREVRCSTTSSTEIPSSPNRSAIGLLTRNVDI